MQRTFHIFLPFVYVGLYGVVACGHFFTLSASRPRYVFAAIVQLKITEVSRASERNFKG